MNDLDKKIEEEIKQMKALAKVHFTVKTEMLRSLAQQDPSKRVHLLNLSSKIFIEVIRKQLSSDNLWKATRTVLKDEPYLAELFAAEFRNLEKTRDTGIFEAGGKAERLPQLISQTADQVFAKGSGRTGQELIERLPGSTLDLMAGTADASVFKLPPSDNNATSAVVEGSRVYTCQNNKVTEWSISKTSNEVVKNTDLQDASRRGYKPQTIRRFAHGLIGKNLQSTLFYYTDLSSQESQADPKDIQQNVQIFDMVAVSKPSTETNQHDYVIWGTSKPDSKTVNMFCKHAAFKNGVLSDFDDLFTLIEAEHLKLEGKGSTYLFNTSDKINPHTVNLCWLFMEEGGESIRFNYYTFDSSNRSNQEPEIHSQRITLKHKLISLEGVSFEQKNNYVAMLLRGVESSSSSGDDDSGETKNCSYNQFGILTVSLQSIFDGDAGDKEVHRVTLSQQSIAEVGKVVTFKIVPHENSSRVFFITENCYCFSVSVSMGKENQALFSAEKEEHFSNTLRIRDCCWMAGTASLLLEQRTHQVYSGGHKPINYILEIRT
jgi:hypothetical protein